jgi:hypothetical protein
LKNENGLADYVRMLDGVSEPALDVETSFRIVSARDDLAIASEEVPRASGLPMPTVRSLRTV